MILFRGRGFARTCLLASSAAAMAALGQPIIRGAFAIPPAAAQAPDLPKPFVSRALDATLLELTPATRATFAIKPGVQGVLVLSTEPHGIAAKNGILPGDVITDIRGRRVFQPIDVDTHVLYYLKLGDTAFQFAGNRGGNGFSTAAQITLALFDALVDLATIGSWSSYSYGSFSYFEYYEEYRVSIVEEYSYSETLIEQTVESSSFETEMTSEETLTEKATSSEEEEATSETETSEPADDSNADQADDADAAEDTAPDEAQENGADTGTDTGDESDDSAEDDSGDDTDLAAAPVGVVLLALA